jgi:hypothetical protein
LAALFNGSLHVCEMDVPIGRKFQNTPLYIENNKVDRIQYLCYKCENFRQDLLMTIACVDDLYGLR